MGVRIAVVVAFALMALAPAYIAYDAGVLPGPTQAAAGADDCAGPATRVTALAWPEEPLGLAASDTAVFWEQRDRSAAVAGLWACDAQTGQVGRVLSRSRTGKSAGFPAAAGDIVVWAAWTGRRGSGLPRIEAYHTASTRRWTAAAAGLHPAAAGRTVVWVDRGGDAGGGDVIRGLNSVTDEEYSVRTGARIRHVATHGSWAAWLSGRGKQAEVWVGSLRGRKLSRLAPAGTAVAIDAGRVAYGVAGKDGTSRLLSWQQKTRKTAPLCDVAGAVSSLTLTRNYVAWVVTPHAGDPAVWVYDLARGEAFPVDENGGRQASPVIVAGSVYWAGERGGGWELFRRALR